MTHNPGLGLTLRTVPAGSHLEVVGSRRLPSQRTERTAAVRAIDDARSASYLAAAAAKASSN